MIDETRCALPGCGSASKPPGAPYCAAHAVSNVGPSARPNPRSREASPQPVRTSEPGPDVPEQRILIPARRRLLDWAPPPLSADGRKRAVAGLAIASLVIGAGGAIAASLSGATPATTALPTIRPQVDPQLWAIRAAVALASIDEQLDEVNHAEARWEQLPVALRAGTRPAAVRALLDRKALLLQQRATVTAQLEAWRALPAAEQDLERSQAQLDSIERSLAGAPRPAEASGPRAAAERALDEQRAIRKQQRDQNWQQLATLRSGVADAMTRPLSIDESTTAAVVDDVTALLAGGPVAPQGPLDRTDPARARAAVLPRRTVEPTRQDLGCSAPPDPERDASALVDTDRLTAVADGLAPQPDAAPGLPTDGGGVDRVEARTIDAPDVERPAPADVAGRFPGPDDGAMDAHTPLGRAGGHGGAPPLSAAIAPAPAGAMLAPAAAPPASTAVAPATTAPATTAAGRTGVAKPVPSTAGARAGAGRRASTPRPTGKARTTSTTSAAGTTRARDTSSDVGTVVAGGTGSGPARSGVSGTSTPTSGRSGAGRSGAGRSGAGTSKPSTKAGRSSARPSASTPQGKAERSSHKNSPHKNSPQENSSHRSPSHTGSSHTGSSQGGPHGGGKSGGRSGR